MSTKREASPGPGTMSANKLSLGKLTGRQNSAGAISIRFSAAAMDDDLDDDDLTIGSSSKAQDETVGVPSCEKNPKSKEVVTIELAKNISNKLTSATCGNHPLALSEIPIPATERSRSAPASEVTTPVSPTGSTNGSSGTERALLHRAASDVTCPPEEEQRSLLAGFRERFQDKIPEPLSQLIDKFSGENSPEERERKLRKSESLDSTRCTEFFGSDKTSKKNNHTSLDKRKSHSRNASADSDVSGVEPLPASISDKIGPFELVEDFYREEPFEDFTGSVSVGLLRSKRSSSSDQISRSVSPHKPKSKLQRLIGSLDKGSPSHRSVSMTLSGLLSNREEDSELSEDEFFDPEEQQSIPSNDNFPIVFETKPSDKYLPKEEKKPSPNSSGLPFQKMIAATVALFAYLIIPLPSFINGLCLGVATTLGVVRFYQWWHKPSKAKTPFVLPCLDELPPLQVPDMVASKNEDGKFKVWMNELYQYNPDDYHISKTHSVYVQLEGMTLRLQRPKHNVPKRAMWDERPLATPTFIHQRHFDLIGSNVSLVPPGLVKKRLWSKKYPICVALAKTGSKVEQRLKKEGSAEAEFARGMGYEVVPEVCDDSVLFLFARTGREKEAWFRRLDAASRGDPLPTRMSDLVFPPITANSSLGTADHQHHPDRQFSDYEVGTDVVSKLQKRHSTPNLIRQPTPPLSSAPPSFSTTTTTTTTTTTAAATTTTTTLPTLPTDSANTTTTTTGSSIIHRRQDSADSISSIHSEPIKDVPLPPPPPAPSEVLLTEYIHFMGQVMPADPESDAPLSANAIGTSAEPRGSSRASSPTSPPPKPHKDSKEEKTATKKEKRDKDAASAVVTSPRSSCEVSVRWLNAILGRCFWDFLRESQWAERMQERIQRKLSKIHVPYMIDELTVTDIDMGKETPFIRRISAPYLDDQGLWVDVDVAYNGGFQMSLETKVNLMKLKKAGNNGNGGSEEAKSPLEKRSPVTDSEEEDSAESSTDEEDEPALDSPDDRAEGGKSTSRKLLRLVDKITQSKYFQQATEYKYIKRAMEEVSNTPLQLTVGLHSLIGTIAINIPPPPTDRIWYGFRTNPKLCLQAKPKVGTREVTVTHITDWIEKKLQIEFQRIFVMPNMDDLPVPLMSDLLSTTTTPPPSLS